MRTLYRTALLVCMALFSGTAHAQECLSADPAVCWPVQITGTNHTLLVLTSSSPELNGAALPAGTWIGVFYDSAGVDRCGGYVQWTGANTSIAAQGEDLGDDGFATGEVFRFKYLLGSGDVVSDVTATWAPPGNPVPTDDSTFTADGISQLASLSGTLLACEPTDTTISETVCTPDETGTVTNTYTAAGGCDSVVTVISVLEEIPPTAICRNLTVQLDGNGTASITPSQLNNGSTDNCGVPALSASQTAFTCLDQGGNTVTVTATDPAGNTATCQSLVTVTDPLQACVDPCDPDITSPTALCQDVSVQLDGFGMAFLDAEAVDAGSSDACGPVLLNLSKTIFDCRDTGTVEVLLLVTDGSGNGVTCSANVTVNDNLAPTALCQNITVQLNAGGTAAIQPGDLDVGSTDNCGNVQLSASPLSFQCADIGNNTVQLTTEDAAGNSASCQATVTVADNLAPTAQCQNITVQLSAGGTATIQPADIDAGSADNCGNVQLSASPLSFQCADIGSNSVQLTAEDAAGNTASCQATVTVTDNLAPTALCQNITVQLSAGGTATIQPADIDAGSTDNCGNVQLSASPLSFQCADIGSNTVQLTAEDDEGNTASCQATVTVTDPTGACIDPCSPDITNPAAICRDITVQLDENGLAPITPGLLDAGSTDACGGVSLSASLTTVGCGDVGEVVVILTATDDSDNQDQCQATVTVTDPLRACPCEEDHVLVESSSCNPADTGTVVTTLVNQEGCDSVVTVVTSLSQPYYVEIFETTCLLEDESKKEYYLTASNGCDSTVRVYIVWQPPVVINLSALTCNPEEVGTTVTTFTGSQGCDSTVIVNYQLAPSSAITLHETSCLPADTGTFVQVLPGWNGCDSVITTIVELSETITHTIQTTTCIPGEEGTETTTYTASNGCDSVVTIITTLEPAYTQVVYQTSCNPQDGGTETIHLTAANGCDSLVIIKTEIEAVNAGFRYESNGTTTSFTNTGSYATNFLWLLGDGTTSTEENPVHTYNRNGIYLVWQIAYAPLCGFDLALKLVFVFDGASGREMTARPLTPTESPTSVETYPNPGPGVFHFRIKGLRTGSWQVAVYDAMGGLRHEQAIHSDSPEIDLSRLTPGHYLIQLSDGKSTVWDKILILR